MQKIIQSVRKELKINIDKKYKIGSERFFKEKITIYGVRTPIVRQIAKRYSKEIKKLDKGEVFEIAENLFKNKYNEETTIATQWIIESLDKITDKDFPILSQWIEKYLDNWAKIDDYCNHVINPIIIKHPSLMKEFKKWSTSKNRWVRRASAVSLVSTNRDFYKKENNLDFVFWIARKLFRDPEDLVQKGYGWMLKVASNNRQKEVFDFVMKHRKSMSRTALRYAIEKMPKDLKIKAMKND